MATTALITGASTGIGYELALILAKNKINLVLVARSKEKLLNLQTKLAAEIGIKVSVLDLDLSTESSAQQVIDFCQQQKIKVDYLINNAGFGDYGFFHESDWKKQAEMLQLNIVTLTQLTHLFLPNMIKNKSGKILNVASIAAFLPGPLMSVYYATKAYVLHFSEALANELKDDGITVTTLCPGPTESGFQALAAMEESKLVKGKKMATSNEVAEYGFQAMMKGEQVAIHGFMNKLMVNSIRITPRSLALKIVRQMQDKK
jgi:short-subunit dehydrogenase